MAYRIVEITPLQYRCVVGSCPAIFEITPNEYRCFGGMGCPSAFEDRENKKYLIIGTKVNPTDFGLDARVGIGEVLIQIPKEILENILQEHNPPKMPNVTPKNS